MKERVVSYDTKLTISPKFEGILRTNGKKIDIYDGNSNIIFSSEIKLLTVRKVVNYSAKVNNGTDSLYLFFASKQEIKKYNRWSLGGLQSSGYGANYQLALLEEMGFDEWFDYLKVNGATFKSPLVSDSKHWDKILRTVYKVLIVFVVFIFLIKILSTI